MRTKIEITNYRQELEKQKKIWNNKPILRQLYKQWYDSAVKSFSAGENNIEIGSGCGNFKDFCLEKNIPLITTDCCPLPWIDKILDANNLNLPEYSLNNIFMFDVLHHLSDVSGFFTRAEQALQKNGRLIIIEPFFTPFSYFIYKYFHHEPFDLNFDPYTEKGIINNNESFYANEALATILFKKNLKKFEKTFNFKIIKKIRFSFILYPLTGGFNYPARINTKLYPLINFFDYLAIKLLPGLLGHVKFCLQFQHRKLLDSKLPF